MKLAAKLPKGTYTVAWRAVSSDSHPISGAFTFSIGRPSVTSVLVPTGSSDDTAVSRLYDFFRYVAYGGVTLLIGIALFLLACWPGGAGLRRLRRLFFAGWTTLVAATVVLLLLRGPFETGRGLSAVLDLPLLGRTVTGRTGLAFSARLILLAVSGVLLVKLGRDRREAPQVPNGELTTATEPRFGFGVRLGGALLAVGLALTWAAAEHASAGLQVPLAIPLATLHLLAMAAWLGGLIALAATLFRAPAGRAVPASAVTCFSRLAFTAVALLVATGLYQSWRQVGSLEALSTTEYGRTLNLKAAVVAVALTAAWFSRLWTAQLTREQPREARPVAQPVRVAQAVGTSSSSAAEEGNATGLRPPRKADDDTDPSASERGRRGLRRTVAVEAVLGVVVLAITTLLTGTQPGRAEVQNAAAVAAAQEPTARVVNVPFDAGIPNGSGRAQITFAPGRVGDNTVQALLYGADQGVVAVPELRLTLTRQAQKIGRLDAKLVDRGGYWSSDRLRLPLPGTWTLNLTVRLTDVDQVTVTKNVTIGESPA